MGHLAVTWKVCQCVKCSVSICVGPPRYEKGNKHVLPERLASSGGSTAFPWARFTSCSIALRVSLPTRDGDGHGAFVRQRGRGLHGKWVDGLLLSFLLRRLRGDALYPFPSHPIEVHVRG
jgi:hypothetical protein